jgi:hypothetical protein
MDLFLIALNISISEMFRSGFLLYRLSLPITVVSPYKARVLAAWILGPSVRIPLKAWMYVESVYAVLSCGGRDLTSG